MGKLRSRVQRRMAREIITELGMDGFKGKNFEDIKTIINSKNLFMSKINRNLVASEIYKISKRD